MEVHLRAPRVRSQQRLKLEIRLRAGFTDTGRARTGIEVRLAPCAAIGLNPLPYR